MQVSDGAATAVPVPRRGPDVARFLADSAARVGAGLDLQATLDRVVSAVVELLGFEVAVLNLAVGDDLLEVVSAAGPDEMRDQLLGTAQSRMKWGRILTLARPMGALRFVHHDDVSELEDEYSWVPDLPVVDDPAAWHPLDSLFAPLKALDGELLGVLSVDCPVDGLLPDLHTCHLLELFAVQAALALDNARVHAQLARSEQALRSLFEHAPIGMAVSGMDRVIIAANHAYCSFLGRTEDSLLGSRAADLTYWEDVPESDRVSTDVRARTGNVGKIDKRYVRGDGAIVWGRLSLTRIPGDGEDVVLAQVEDVTAEREARTALERQVRTDALTGLGNRDAVFAELSAALAADRPVAVLFCDVDDFKLVNDTLGHAAGDQLLVLIARDLRAALRPGDSAGRIGGDEFLVVLSDVDDIEVAESVAERIRQVSTRSLAGPGTGASVTTSVAVGLALSRPGQHPDDVLADADRALYAAKRAKDRRTSR